MTELAISALTDVLAACEVFFLAGLAFRSGPSPRSAAFALATYLFLGAFAFMLGAIDHAFLDPVAHPLADPMTAATRIVMALSTLALVVMAARAYLAASARRVLVGLGIAVTIAVVAAIVSGDNFFVPLLAQMVAFLILLALAVRGFVRGETSPVFVVGILLMIGTGFLPPLGVSLAGLGVYGTFHVAAMLAVIVFFLGGRTLPETAPAK